MRTAALIAFFFVAFTAAKAQKFTLLPQAGFESTNTRISYNGLSSFSPLGAMFTPQVAMQFQYASKKGHGAFVGAATSRSIVDFQFADPEKAMNSFTANGGNVQVRMEAGYLYNSKPIRFSKSKVSTAEKSNAQTQKTKCGSYATRSSCNKSSAARKQDIGSWMRIQPSAGMAFIPGVRSSLVSEQAGYEYRAGNWTTALQTGAGFEFGKNNSRLFTVSINYLKGLGNLGTQTISTESDGKPVTTTLQSAADGWNMRIGIPFTLGAKKPAVKAQSVSPKANPYKSRCGEYKPAYRCGRII